MEKSGKFQELLSQHVKEKDCFKTVKTLAAVDVSYAGDTASAACIVTDIKGAILNKTTFQGRPLFPYISSFFALREFPLIYNVLKGVQFDLLFIHGHGRAHPRKFGLACHTGLYFQKPTIGVAGRKLVGGYTKNFEKWTYLHWKGDIIGAVLKTHNKMNPIFVSVGHMISLSSAICYTFKTVKDHKFPEVLQLAHNLSRKGLKQ